jgi:hypothetical protein
MLSKNIQIKIYKTGGFSRTQLHGVSYLAIQVEGRVLCMGILEVQTLKGGGYVRELVGGRSLLYVVLRK